MPTIAPAQLYTLEASPATISKRRRMAEKLRLKQQPRRWIYAIGCGNFVKFGIALSVERRFKHYDTHNPFPCELLGKVWAPGSWESRIFRAAKPWHHRGEWFKVSDEVLTLVVAIKNGDERALDEYLISLKV